MLDTPLLREVERSGFAHPERLIHLFIGGSELHGAKVGTTDDLDLYGVFLDDPVGVLGIAPRRHFVWSTASDDRRNGPDDVDITLYSLHRWCELAAKGNATALHFLFAGATATSSSTWRFLEDRRQIFLSRRSAQEFLGFAENQKMRIRGDKGRGEKGRRPEYENVHGYDSKAAMHCLRLYLECIELMREGRITLPRPERQFLIEVRSGKLTLEQFSAECERLHAEAVQAAAESTLPASLDRAKVSRLLAEVTLLGWREQGWWPGATGEKAANAAGSW